MTAVTPMSPTTERAIAFVASRRERAEALGRNLAEHIDDPAAFAAVLRAAFVELADAEYLEGQHRVAPGIGPILGVRGPLLGAVQRGFRHATRRERTSTWLFVADRLLRMPEMELRWFAFGLLERTIGDEPERTWQLVRRAAHDAGDWITIDSLAHVAGRGILNEPYRWAELEQLVYSPSRWERRLVGSTVATIPFIDRRAGREPLVARKGLELVGQLVGDAEPDVQKALSWALRSLIRVDVAGVTAFSREQAERAAATDDGHRAWVVRDTLPKLDPAAAGPIRTRLASIRRRPGAPSTSSAAEAAERFGGGMLGRARPEPPLA